MTMYARIPPLKARKNHPSPTKRYHHVGVTYRLDAEPDTKPRWYRVSDERAAELATIRLHEDSPLVFEVVSVDEWRKRVEKRIVVNVVDVEGGAKTAKPENVSSAEEEPDVADASGDDGHVDVGKPKSSPKKAPKKKAPKKKAPKKKAPRRSSKKAPRASSK